MLYDPKWEKQTGAKADPFSLESLIAWLETMPADAVYCWVSAGECLLGQFALANGLQGTAIEGKSLALTDDPKFCTIALRGPYTFGAALERARKAAAA